MANGKKTDAAKISAAERQLEALSLRKQGNSYREIAATLSISVGQAHTDIKEAYAELAEQKLESIQELRALEDERLDWLLLALVPGITSGKVDAIVAAMRIGESRRRMFGLDAPAMTALTNPDGTAFGQAYADLRTTVLALLPIEQRLQLADALDQQVIDVTDQTDD